MRRIASVRFGVRTLLILMTLASFWLGSMVIRARQQREAVAWVHSVGGTVTYNWQLDRQGRKNPAARPPGPAWLRRQIGDEYFQSVNRITIADNKLLNDISPLAAFTEAESINLTSNRVSDLRPLSGLKKLKVLWLPGNRIEDLTPLTGLSRLEELYIFVNRVSDISALESLGKLRVLSADQNRIESVEALRSLSNLELIALSDNRVRNLDPLLSLTKVKRLAISGNPISPESAERAKEALGLARSNTGNNKDAE